MIIKPKINFAVFCFNLKLVSRSQILEEIWDTLAHFFKDKNSIVFENFTTQTGNFELISSSTYLHHATETQMTS